MVSHLFFSQLLLVALVWLCVMLQWVWPSDPAAACPTTPEPTSPPPKHHRERNPFASFPTPPHCDACEHAPSLRAQKAQRENKRLSEPKERSRCEHAKSSRNWTTGCGESSLSGAGSAGRTSTAER